MFFQLLLLDFESVSDLFFSQFKFFGLLLVLFLVLDPTMILNDLFPPEFLFRFHFSQDLLHRSRSFQQTTILWFVSSINQTSYNLLGLNMMCLLSTVFLFVLGGEGNVQKFVFFFENISSD